MKSFKIFKLFQNKLYRVLRNDILQKKKKKKKKNYLPPPFAP